MFARRPLAREAPGLRSPSELAAFEPFDLELHPPAHRSLAIDDPPDLGETVAKLLGERADPVFDTVAGLAESNDVQLSRTRRKTFKSLFARCKRLAEPRNNLRGMTIFLYILTSQNIHRECSSNYPDIRRVSCPTGRL